MQQEPAILAARRRMAGLPGRPGYRYFLKRDREPENMFLALFFRPDQSLDDNGRVLTVWGTRPYAGSLDLADAHALYNEATAEVIRAILPPDHPFVLGQPTGHDPENPH